MKRLVAYMTTMLVVMALAVSASADDAQIAKQIISQLSQQKQVAKLKGFDLGVQVDKGTVTMMGQVASPEQAMLALDVARRVQGVKLVVNDLYVSQASTAQKPATAPVSVMRQPIRQAPAYQQAAVQQVAVQQVAAQRVATQQPAMAAPQQPAYQAPVGSAVAVRQPVAQRQMPRAQRPMPIGQSSIQRAGYSSPIARADYIEGGYGGGEIVGGGSSYGGSAPYGGDYGASYGGGVAENPSMPGHAWPSYSAHPHYGSVTYPSQYSATAWPYIGPFYPYPQVPLGWRKVSLEWDDGWWFLDFTKK